MVMLLTNGGIEALGGYSLHGQLVMLGLGKLSTRAAAFNVTDESCRNCCRGEIKDAGRVKDSVSLKRLSCTGIGITRTELRR